MAIQTLGQTSNFTVTFEDSLPMASQHCSAATAPFPEVRGREATSLLIPSPPSRGRGEGEAG
jgi:hypothetical protein